jgi:hypothetical protein
MNQWTEEKLHLNPRSDDDLRGVLAGFEQKWQKKLRRQIADRNSLF